MQRLLGGGPVGLRGRARLERQTLERLCQRTLARSELPRPDFVSKGFVVAVVVTRGPALGKGFEFVA